MGQIIYSKEYSPTNTIFHAWHHAGGTEADAYASASGLTLEGVNNAHKLREFGLSSLRWYIGYNFLIFARPVPNGIGPWGNIIQTRAVGETTCAQKGYNFKGQVISICFINHNFNWDHGAKMEVDPPTETEENAARWLNQQLPSLLLANNKPHRFFSQTKCYGDGLSDNYIQTVLNKNNGEDLKKKLLTLQALLAVYQKLLALLHTTKLGLMGRGTKLGAYLPNLTDCQQSDVR